MAERISLTVNGENHTVTAAPRTQLAEVLRDHLDLTGTHVSCEQGVCGACTVMVDGQPVRSCITFVNACDGAVVETIEGYRDDLVMDKIRDAFSRHHALQCGFCTPGMLATAHDILKRFHRPDETTIRHELSGNLCRCTGYVGIVAAIDDVAAQLNPSADGGDRETSTPRKRALSPFAITQPDEADLHQIGGKQAREIRTESNWTIINRQFTLAYPRIAVWRLFSDVGKIAGCVPGASITTVTQDTFKGVVEIRFGPIRAQFDGEGAFENDDDTQTGSISGRGEDKGGRSNIRAEMHYALASGTSEGETGVTVELKFQIQGMLAQFNRPELVTDFADFILERFIANCNSVLSGGSADASRKIGIFGLGYLILKSTLRSVFKR